MAEARIKYREAEISAYDLMNAIQCQVIYNAHGIKETKPADFMITRREVETITNVEAIDQKFQHWVAMGGK